MLFDALAQIALAAVARHPSRGMNDAIQRLVIRALGLVAMMVMGIVALLCALAGAVLALAPHPLDVQQVLFILAALFVLIALLTWLIACKAQSPREMIAEALKSQTSPLDKLTDTFDKVGHAFNRGWHTR